MRGKIWGDNLEMAGIPRMTVQEVKKRIDRGEEVVLVDVRKASVYARGHIPGALCLPITEIEERYGELPTGKLLIFY